MTRLGFMSQEHVDEMNALLENAPTVRAAAAALGADRLLVFELGDGPDEETVYWRAAMGPSGFRFGVGAPADAADVVLRCDWTAMMFPAV